MTSNHHCVQEKLENTETLCPTRVLFGTIIRAGLSSSLMTFAIVKVFPDPVTPLMINCLYITT